MLVIEMTIPDDNRASPAQLFDLNMLVMTGGQERMVSEYEALLGKAGFRLIRTIPTGTPFKVLEAAAA
jgi:C-methyltransferase